MKLLCTGDWHLSIKKPRSRKDDYVKSLKHKVSWIINTARMYDVAAILQPGDFCDQWEAPDIFKTTWIQALRYSPPIYTVPGQHDCRYHTSDIMNTPLGVLKEALGLFVINDTKECLTLSYGREEIKVYGAGWGKDVPIVKRDHYFNVLLTHRMIAMDRVWAGQEDYEIAGTFLRKHNFDLIVSGDNHSSFHYKDGDRILINCGNLMRNRIDQINHEPCVWLIDTEDKTSVKMLVPIEPFDSVMNIEIVERKKDNDEKLKELSSALKKKSRLTGLNYKKRVNSRVNELKSLNKLNPRTEYMIGEVMKDG